MIEVKDATREKYIGDTNALKHAAICKACTKIKKIRQGMTKGE